MFICLSACVHLRVSASIQSPNVLMRVYVYTCACVCECVHVCLCECVCVCVQGVQSVSLQFAVVLFVI